jgi:hypothetical protein
MEFDEATRRPDSRLTVTIMFAIGGDAQSVARLRMVAEPFRFSCSLSFGRGDAMRRTSLPRRVVSTLMPTRSSLKQLNKAPANHEECHPELNKKVLAAYRQLHIALAQAS